MQHPIITNANANERLNQMVREAEIQRLRKRVTLKKAGRDLLSDLKDRLPVFQNQHLDESANSPA